MLEESVDEAIAVWRELQAAVDDTTRRGETGYDVLRLVSTVRLSLENFLYATSKHHQSLRQYLATAPTHFLHCQNFYRTLYLKMFNALDKSTAARADPDGYALNDVAIDPCSALNTISTAPVTVVLPGDNAAVLKYPPSTLGTVHKQIDARLATLRLYVEQEQTALETRVTLEPVPERDETLYDQLHQIQTVLAPLTVQSSAVLGLYGLCGKLQALVTRLQETLVSETANMQTLRDNVLAMFMEGVRLYDKMTHTYALQQSRQGGFGLGTIF